MTAQQKRRYGFGTQAVHAGQEPDASTGAIMTPIYQTSTFAQTAPGEHKGFEYARISNPTRSALERNLAALEGARYGIAFASGVAAIDAVLRGLCPGDHVIATDDIYGGTYRLFKQVFEPLGIQSSFVNMADLSAVLDAVLPSTKLMWIETPTNPLLRILDIQALARHAHENGIDMLVDNTFATPYLQRPLESGADIVLHSTTKYLGGHSDVVGGVVVTDRDDWNEKLRFQIKGAGAVPGPMDCFLLLRSTKTLHLRMERHCHNAGLIAGFLEGHPKVDTVRYPGLSTHPGHNIAQTQMRGFGGMVSFSLVDDRQEPAFKLLSNTTLFSLAESLGGVESLIGHPATMTHASIPRDDRIKRGLSDSLIRLSVGVEDADDLIADLDAVLKTI